MRGNKNTKPRIKHTRKDGVNKLKRLVDLLANLGSGQDNLSADEDEKHNLGLHHAIDKTGEELGLVRAERMMAAGETLKTDREFDVTRSHHVLNLELGKLGVETKLLNDASKLPGRKLGIILRLSTSDNHFAGCENQSRCLGLTNTHRNGRKTLRVVFRIASMKRDGLEVKPAVKINCRNDVS